MKYYSQVGTRLIYTGNRPTPDFWGKVWKKEKESKKNISGKFDLLVVPNTKKYLSPGAKILEGGCGDGRYVQLLCDSGYDCWGVDNAKGTANMLKNSGLNGKAADVRHLPFRDSSFDAYWSIGVIEHFWKGYNKVAEEINCVLKPGGILFLTFPHMSFLRKIKSKLGIYPTENFPAKPDNFYQFALNSQEVEKEFNRLGFKLVEKKSFDGFKGLREEIPGLEFIFGPIAAASKTNYLAAAVRFIISKISENFSGHCSLLILRKI